MSVYAVEPMCNVDRVVYIGSTININKRWFQHSRRDNDSEVAKLISNSPDNIQLRILESGISPDKLKQREQYYIDKFINEGYIPLNSIRAYAGGNTCESRVYSCEICGVTHRGLRAKTVHCNTDAHNLAMSKHIYDKVKDMTEFDLVLDKKLAEELTIKDSTPINIKELATDD